MQIRNGKLKKRKDGEEGEIQGSWSNGEGVESFNAFKINWGELRCWEYFRGMGCFLDGWGEWGTVLGGWGEWVTVLGGWGEVTST